jgi:small subunit ribosomal protein S1
VSQISQKRIKTPAEVLKEGETVKVKVTKVDGNRISLSMKALDENAPAEQPREKEEKISFKLPKSEAIGTGLGDLLKGLKL